MQGGIFGDALLDKMLSEKSNVVSLASGLPLHGQVVIFRRETKGASNTSFQAGDK